MCNETKKFEFGTKAETLERLIPFSKDFILPDAYYFTKSHWIKNKTDVLKEISKRFINIKVAIRSSCTGEDGEHASLSGAFETRLDIDSNNPNFLQESIASIFASYPSGGTEQDQVLVQKMVLNTTVSGVIMTHVIDDGSPYYIFNYDDETKTTDTITGGIGSHKTVLVYRNAAEEVCESIRIRKMLRLARELENICQSSHLDIEFAFGSAGEVYLLQVRRMTTNKSWAPDCQFLISRAIPHLESFVQNLTAPRVGLYGKRTILGNMPDWNPAEIIGVHPSPLTSSLYRHLITSETWAYARVRMGYRKIPKSELMVMVSGSPYIDVRVSFNSFLPKNLSPHVSEKLINAWLDRLSNKPELHDKIEFDIVPTIYDFDFATRFESFYGDLLTPPQLKEYAHKLHILTKNALNLNETGTLGLALRSIDKLIKIQKNKNFSPPLKDGPVSTVAWISATLDFCIEYGTLPFSILARHAFIAESLLRSMVRLGAISQERIAVFKNSFATVLGELSADTVRLNEGKISEFEFLDKYGHLRPGTYDIMAVSYRERNHLFKNSTFSSIQSKTKEFSLSSEECKKINKLFFDAGFSKLDAHSFFEYAQKAITGREYSKFIFTKSLSAVIDVVLQWGKFYNLGREELSLLKIADIIETSSISTKDNPAKILINHINNARLDAKSDRLLKMGYLIRTNKDLYVVPIHRASPNFITDQQIEGKVIFLKATSTTSLDVEGKIVCIENADPGFDWIFSKNIIGLITKYGGVNSHMSIRCSEISLPAAIGCGDLIFSSISDGETVVLSCKSKMIRTVIS